MYGWDLLGVIKLYSCCAIYSLQIRKLFPRGVNKLTVRLGANLEIWDKPCPQVHILPTVDLDSL